MDKPFSSGFSRLPRFDLDDRFDPLSLFHDMQAPQIDPTEHISSDTFPTHFNDGEPRLKWVERLNIARKYLQPFRRLKTIEVHEESRYPDDFVDLFRNSRDREMFNRKMQINILPDDRLCRETGCRRLDPVPHDHPKRPNYTRFVVISDTHGEHRNMEHPLPPGDVLLHCGDFTDLGKLEEVKDFNDWLGTLPYKHKFVICGNHELSFDPKIVDQVRKCIKEDKYCRFMHVGKIPEEITNDWRSVLTNCILLHDQEISVNGIRIYGCPWNPMYGGWAFNVRRGEELLEKWNKIPGDGIHILMTHCPPAGQLDVSEREVEADDYDPRGPYKTKIIKERVGCVELMNTVQLRVKPKYHLFGHIHEAYGYTSDGWHQFLNCSTINRQYKPINKAMVIDLPNVRDAKEGLGELIQH